MTFSDFSPDGENTIPIIEYYSESTDFRLKKEQAVSKWLYRTAKKENRLISQLSYIFCSDDYLYQMNREYLKHDTLTDVITFSYSEIKSKIEGDIFISIDRVEENAKNFNTSFEVELYRVIVHGLFHLCGYSDKTLEEAAVMRKKEDEAIQSLHATLA